MTAPSSSHRSRSDVPYVALFVVVTLAVTVGNLLSTWITAELAARQAQAAAAKAAAALRAAGAAAARDAEVQSRRSQAAAEAARRQVQEARRGDRVGAALARACDDWTKAHAELNTYTTGFEQEKACSALANYVDSGRAPR